MKTRTMIAAGGLLLSAALVPSRAFAELAPVAAALATPPMWTTQAYGNSGMRTAGIVVTSLGIASTPLGLALFLVPDHAVFQCNPDFCLGGREVAGLLIAALGSTLLPAIGIPLWVNGAKPRQGRARAAIDSWTVAPLTLPPLHGSVARGAVPAGLTWIRSF